MKESLRRKGDSFPTARQSKWNNDFSNALKRQKKDEVVPMVVDAASAGKPRNQNWSVKNDKLKKEGRCFYCQERGHMKSDCPKKNTTPKKPFARVAETEEEEELPKDGRKVARVIKSMGDQEREDLLDSMMNETGF